jgi:hypothetical protein
LKTKRAPTEADALQMKPAAAKFVTTASRKLGGLCATNNAKLDGAGRRRIHVVHKRSGQF